MVFIESVTTSKASDLEKYEELKAAKNLVVVER